LLIYIGHTDRNAHSKIMKNWRGI